MSKPVVLVTGGLGFIGSNWIDRFSSKYEIFVLDAFKTGSDPINVNVTNIKGGIHLRQCEIGEIEEDFLKFVNPSYVINFAAESHVDRSISAPVSFVENNVLQTAQFLDKIKNVIPDTKVVHISTDEVYGELGIEDDAFTENNQYSPRSPYSASKAASDHIVMSFYHTFGIKVCITHCCNNYGPKQYHEKLIPVVIKSALKGEKIPVYGAGQNIREWIFVDDHNDALTAVMERGNPGETYCIGSGVEHSNIDIVKKICSYLDEIKPVETAREELIEFVEDRQGHDFRYAINASKIKEQLGWSPRFNFDLSLKRTIDWYVDKIEKGAL
jgi:dTDP-glucose 4,6-dehydratase